MSVILGPDVYGKGRTRSRAEDCMRIGSDLPDTNPCAHVSPKMDHQPLTRSLLLGQD
jgi:hypothetical protein